MARYTGPKVRLSRKFGEDIFGNTTKRMQGRNQNVRRRKTSEYGIMLAEKQKAKYTYGVLEKQFRNLFDKAAKFQRLSPVRSSSRASNAVSTTSFTASALPPLVQPPVSLSTTSTSRSTVVW